MDNMTNETFSGTTMNRMAYFQTNNDIFSKGKLSLVIQFTRMAKGRAFPLRAEDFQTDSKGQVTGIGGGNLKKILKEHGIMKQLTSEGGRTSRGSMGLMMAYVDFLNEWAQETDVNLDEVENFWAEEIRKYFNNQPFILSSDTSRTIRANLDDLFEQARKRERENPGSRYLGVVLQHLVAAKLQIVMPEASFDIHGASVADAVTARTGDFVINNTIIHCTTFVGDLLIEKCKSNLRSGASPIIITLSERKSSAVDHLADADIAGRVEVWDIQQFLSSNVMEHSSFADNRRNATLAEIVEHYNRIIDAVETDPSLKIQFDV